MKKSLCISAAVMAFVVFTFQLAFSAGLNRIDGDELRKMMKDGGQITIVDVREPELFAKGHIPGAINIPYDGAHSRILKELSPKDRIVFVCHGGPMGDELGDILIKNGYASVYNLKGGMRHWSGPFSVK
ncbi:MAG: rhodanese-like domain-containing protein [Deltaproteobacteria bacterium]|nr:rhodanese-like domain-containing protein [Deltaproteobacteria bacterium]